VFGLRPALSTGVILATLIAISSLGAQPASAAATATAATVHGVVTAPGGGAPDAPVTVTLGSATTTTAADGSYSFTGLAAGTYSLVFDYTGTSKIVHGEHWDGTFGSVNAGIVLQDGDDRGIDVRLVAGADVSGQVTGADGALDATTRVTLLWRGGGLAYSTAGTFDVASQTWRVSDVAPGTYSVLIRPTPRWKVQQWGGLQVVAGVDFVETPHQLPRSPEIGGDVTYVDKDGVTRPLPDGIAWASMGPTSGVLSAPIVNGRYDIYDVWTPATYSVCFEEVSFVDVTCIGGGHDMYNSPAVTMAYGQVLEHADLSVVRGGLITGKLAGVGTPLWRVRLLRFDSGSGTYGAERDDYPSASSSRFGFSDVVPGTYRLQVTDETNANNAQYWNGARYAEQASDIVVTSGDTVDLGTITTTAHTVDTTRVDGTDRFAVSVAVSQQLFKTVPAAGVPVVYVANGLNFPDALSAGPAAIKQHGGLLLVTPSKIPAVVQDELVRLRPQRIVVVGGPASVSDAVLHQLDHDVTGPSGVAERLTGADRFAASRNLARNVFQTDGAATVFITTGNDYPDALSAGPAAGSVGAPVVLVNGLAPHLDGATIALLHDLKTTQVDIVGGYASVSVGIEEDLQAIVGADHITIFGGSTRYDNAAQLGEAFFRYTDNALLATGTNFPDALSAAALAGQLQAPIDLVQTACIPLTVGYWLDAQEVQHAWLVGGPASLGPGVESLTPCAS